MPFRDRRLDVQGLRAVAVLAVVIFHAGLPLPGGFAGVDVFFVISGYVITLMLMREYSSAGRISFRNFYKRRFWRIMPALSLMVSVVLAIGLVVLPPFGEQKVLAETAVGAMLSIANLIISLSVGGYFDAPAEANPLLNTWSLSVEEQFYLVFPIALLGALLAERKFGMRQLAVVALFVIAALSLSSILLYWDATASWLPLAGDFYSPISRFWEFLFGALLAMLPAPTRLAPRVSGLLGWIGFGVILTSFAIINPSGKYPSLLTTFPVLGAVLVIWAGSQANSGPTRLLSASPLTRVGDWSYSIYLWHWPLIVFTELLWPGQPSLLVAAALASLVPALLSYQYVEVPLRQLPFSGKQLRLRGGVLIGTPVLLAAGLAVAAVQSLWLAPLERIQMNLLDTHLGWSECMEMGTISGAALTDPSTCHFNVAGTRPTIYLAGDSSAAQLSDGLVRASSALNRPVHIMTAAGCPFADVYRRAERFPREADFRCREMYEKTKAELEVAPPGLVVLSVTDSYWWQAGYEIGLTWGGLREQPDHRAQVLEAGILSAVIALQASGHQVLLVEPPPRIGNPGYEWNPVTCSLIEVIRTGCEVRVPLATMDFYQAQAIRSIRRVAAITGVKSLDLRPSLCSANSCSSVVDGQLYWMDATHISPAASRDLSATFATAIKDAAEGTGT